MLWSRFRTCVNLLLAGVVVCAAWAGGRSAAAAQAPADAPALRERLTRVGTEVFSHPERATDSIKELKAILAADPALAEGHLLLGLAYRTVGTPELMGEAKAELVQALTLNPGLLPARLYLANIYLDLGRPAKAKEELEVALTQSPGRPQFLALLGEAERQLKNPQKAVELTRQALAPDPAFAQARYYLALALFDLKQRDEAIRELEEVVAANPPLIEPYLSLGTAYVEAGRLTAALTTLQRGVQINPTRPELHIQMARAYRLKGALASADAQLKLAMPAGGTALASAYDQQTVDADFYLESGLLKMQRGSLAAAASDLQKALNMDPDQAVANRAMAEVCLLQGAYPRAAEYAARAATLGAPLPAAKSKLLQDKLRATPPTTRP